MTDKLINNILAIHKENITTKVCHQARRALIDYLSVTIAGAKVFCGKETTYMDTLDEIGYATVIGLERKCSMQTSALMNGMSAHVIELDDGHRQGALHVGSTVFSALLAVAEKEKLSSEDFLYGAIIPSSTPSSSSFSSLVYFTATLLKFRLESTPIKPTPGRKLMRAFSMSDSL